MEQPVRDNGMKMGMKPSIIPEDVNHHNHAQYSLIETQQRSKEPPDAFFGTVAQFRQEFPVVLKIGAAESGC